MLDRPNIATIDSIEHAGALHALVMGLVEGPTLGERITRGSLPPTDALATARQLADALEAAHERGVVHRDLKPANIRFTTSGRLGCLLFELLSGRRAFAGRSLGETLAAMLKDEPDWAALPDVTPPSVRRLVQRCLEKDPYRRLHDIADARIEIDDALQADDWSLACRQTRV